MSAHLSDAQQFLAVSILSAAAMIAAALLAYRAHFKEAHSGLTVIQPGPAWKKSTRSAQSNCVEVASARGVILVRDSKNPVDGEALSFPEDSWMEFIGSVKRGEMG